MLYGLGGMTICFLLVTSMFCFQDAFYSNLTESVSNYDTELKLYVSSCRWLLLRVCCLLYSALVSLCHSLLVLVCSIAVFILIPIYLPCSCTGAIPWLMVSELFQQETRPFAVSVATVVNWLSNFAVGEAFPYMLVNLSSSFSFYALTWGFYYFTELSQSICYHHICCIVWPLMVLWVSVSSRD